MSLAKKLREVVAANFIEIARVDTPPVQEDTPEPSPVKNATEGMASAESELDSFLKDIGAAPTTASDTVRLADTFTETPAETIAAPVEEVPLPPKFSLADVITADGDVDFDGIYKHYELPVASFSAEQAMNMLQALPRDLALHTKRVTVNTTLAAIGKVVGATPTDIVADATRKKDNLEKYLSELSEEVADTTTETEAEIERLQQEIAAHREKLRGLTRKQNAAVEVCNARMNMFNQVMHFFDYDEANLNAPQVQEEAEVDPEDMPAFMREDHVRKMLGINEEEEGEFDPVKFAAIYGTGEEENNAAASSESEAPRRNSRRRNGTREAETVP